MIDIRMNEKQRPEVEIFPHRLPSDETVAKFLEKVQNVGEITQITMHGPQIYYTKKIRVAEKNIPLKIQVSRFWIEMEKLDELEKLKDICNEIFSYGYSIKIGRFTKESGKALGLGGRAVVIRTDFLKGKS